MNKFMITNMCEFNHVMENLSQALNEKPVKYDFLPSDVKTVVIRDNTIIVVLTDGTKGVSKCNSQDEMDYFTGFCISYYKAKNTKSYELKNVLKFCVESARKKGYKQAILKNVK